MYIRKTVLLKQIYKYGLLILCSIIMAILIYILLIVNLRPGEETIEQNLYSYSIKPDTTYEAILKPNKLYEKTTLGEGMVYFTEIVDVIKANISYYFTGEHINSLNGEYEILGIMEGFVTDKDGNNVTIWEKSLSILGKTPIQSQDSTVSLTQEVALQMEEYNKLAEEILELTNTDAQVKLNVSMNVTLNLVTDYGEIVELSNPNITIPLSTSMYEITKGGNEEKLEDKTETIIQKLPINTKLVVLFSVLLGIVFLALLFLIIFVEGYKEDKLVVKVRKIFKEYGSRLVALAGNFTINTVQNEFYVHEMIDLVKISDELEKPILYVQSENLTDIQTFYILNNDIIYIYDLHEPLDVPKKEAVQSQPDLLKESDVEIAG